MQIWDDVDAYISELFVGKDDALDEALRASDEAGLPPIAVAPNQGRFLCMLARLMGAKRILEFGTLGGYSTIWLGRGLPDDGTLVTLEYVPRHAEVARKNIERAGLSDKVEIRVGPAIETVKDLDGPFDLVFIDADKETYPEYFAASLELSRPGTLIIADNVVRDGDVIDPNTADQRVRAVRRFNEIVANEKRVDATILQTVGIKGYDGLAFALVRR